jgi:hypothetical protein
MQYFYSPYFGKRKVIAKQDCKSEQKYKTFKNVSSAAKTFTSSKKDSQKKSKKLVIDLSDVPHINETDNLNNLFRASLMSRKAEHKLKNTFKFSKLDLESSSPRRLKSVEFKSSTPYKNIVKLTKYHQNRL